MDKEQHEILGRIVESMQTRMSNSCVGHLQLAANAPVYWDDKLIGHVSSIIDDSVTINLIHPLDHIFVTNRLSFSIDGEDNS